MHLSLQETIKRSKLKSMKMSTGLSNDGQTLYLIIHAGEPIVFDMTMDSAKDVLKLIHELIEQAKAQQSFLAMEKSNELNEPV